MELNKELCALRRKLSQQNWLDDSFGCCLPLWYCPFITSTSIALRALKARLGAKASENLLPF